MCVCESIKYGRIFETIQPPEGSEKNAIQVKRPPSIGPDMPESIAQRCDPATQILDEKKDGTFFKRSLLLQYRQNTFFAILPHCISGLEPKGSNGHTIWPSPPTPPHPHPFAAQSSSTPSIPSIPSYIMRDESPGSRSPHTCTVGAAPPPGGARRQALPPLLQRGRQGRCLLHGAHAT